MPSSRKRIAIVTQDPTHRGGVLRLVHFMYDRAIAAGLEPHVLHYASYRAHPGLHVSFVNTLRGKFSVVPKKEDYKFEGMNVTAIGSALPEWEPQRIAPNMLWRNTLRDFDAAMLVTGSGHIGLPIVEAGKQFVAWISSTVEHDRRKRLSESRDLATTIEKLGLRQVKDAEQIVLNGAKRLLAVSNDTESSIRHLVAGLPIEVWPFPIDTKKFNSTGPPSLSEPQRILFVGRAGDPRKQFGLFAQVMHELSRVMAPNTFRPTLVSAMEVPADIRTTYPNVMRDLEIFEHVTEEELIGLYRASTALVVTSEQEGLGIGIMEAMACGTPVISTRCGGPEMLIEHGVSGFLTSFDVREIAQHVGELLLDSGKATRMGRAAEERIHKQFSEEQWNAKFEQMLRDLVQV